MVTNQQIADLLSQAAERAADQTAAFTASVERLIANDNRHHEKFRKRLEDLALAQAVLKADVENNTEFRKGARMLAIGVIVIPVLTTIVQLIFK